MEALTDCLKYCITWSCEDTPARTIMKSDSAETKKRSWQMEWETWSIPQKRPNLLSPHAKNTWWLQNHCAQNKRHGSEREYFQTTHSATLRGKKEIFLGKNVFTVVTFNLCNALYGAQVLSNRFPQRFQCGWSWSLRFCVVGESHPMQQPSYRWGITHTNRSHYWYHRQHIEYNSSVLWSGL